MNEQKNNGRGIFYGVIGVATLVVAIVGATFAYFTASATAGENEITGNMASINFGLTVTKMTTVDETKGGMIPMSNTMVEAAASKTAGSGVCTDDNDNAVCQIYKITVTNTGTASLFLDGYVSLYDAEGKISYTPTDIEATEQELNEMANVTVMRWAQVFQSGSAYTTVGTSTTGATVSGTPVAFTSLDAPSDTTGWNRTNIKTTGVTTTGTIGTNPYMVINTNYIRISNHDNTEGTGYDRTDDITSALVYNQPLDPAGGTAPTVDYYIVVWLTETGTNQTPQTSDTTPNPNALNFFNGTVTFISAQGSEVTATFGSYSRVPSNT